MKVEMTNNFFKEVTIREHDRIWKGLNESLA